jgi:hypothetical protein
VFGQIDRVLRWIEINHLLYIRFVSAKVKMTTVPCAHPLKTVFRPPAINAAQEQGGYL